MQVILESITPNAEELIERAARTCYQSLGKINPPKSTEHLIKLILKNGHHSVLEHASATFRIKGCSRVMSHELVRHRLMSISQESQRYVKYIDGIEFVCPPSIKEKGLEQKYNISIMECYKDYACLLEAGIPPEDARYVLPSAVCSEIVITANFRELRHIIQLRTSNRAHWEIKSVANEILTIMKEKAPLVFSDL